MSDWQIGDLALCVKTTPWRLVKGARKIEADPKAGRIYSVTRVGRDPQHGLWIAVEDFEPHRFRAFQFRKVTPDEADEFDRETIELEQTRPVRVPVGSMLG